MLKKYIKHIKRSKAGFTLIEVITAVAIIAIMALLIIPSYTGAQENARIRVDEATLRTIKTFLVQYEADYGEYPATLEELAEVNGTEQFKTTSRRYGVGRDYEYDGNGVVSMPER